MLTRAMAEMLSIMTRYSARLLTGARSIWRGCQPELKQRIYFANHNSHIDFILLWSSLPRRVRHQTHPIAASDYWLKNRFRRFIIQDTFSGIVIQRHRQHAEDDPLQPVKAILAQGDSIIFFPEGTRNLNDDCELLEFKSGLYHLQQQFPQVEIVPVWISNLKRVMPKGAIIPLPLLSTVIFGEPLQHTQAMPKDEFLAYAQQQLLKLKEFEYQ
ncbi:lysophospholipid acyltransferase family protein [Acinetobacter brisouii]|uniref:lysophospholipid acyltransferase family protein n=1 Tax=Acinetobacter brisouii TaxID=396323 RepID=UPI00124C3B08